MKKNKIIKSKINLLNISENKFSLIKKDVSSNILIPVMHSDENSEVSKHFGHAPFFAVFNVLSKELIFEKNTLVHNDSNITAVDQAIEKFNPLEVFVDNIGKKAIDIFNKHGVKIHTQTIKKLNEILESYY